MEAIYSFIQHVVCVIAEKLSIPDIIFHGNFGFWGAVGVKKNDFSSGFPLSIAMILISEYQHGRDRVRCKTAGLKVESLLRTSNSGPGSRRRSMKSASKYRNQNIIGGFDLFSFHAITHLYYHPHLLSRHQAANSAWCLAIVYRCTSCWFHTQTICERSAWSLCILHQAYTHIRRHSELRISVLVCYD